jgi:hypothetical protein
MLPLYPSGSRERQHGRADVRAGKQNPKQALDDAARQWQLILDEGYREA